MPTDIFRPRAPLPRALYDAFQAEAARRNANPGWMLNERMAVWRAARDYAQQHGMRVPTITQVVEAETYAEGHTDYGAKWAYRLAEIMETPDAP